MSSVMDQFRPQVKSSIESHGVHVWGIFGNETGPSFAYTTGMAQHQLPEFLVVGFDPHTSHYVIMSAVAALRDNKREAFENGEVFAVDGKEDQRVVIFDARESVKDDYTIQTGQYYGTEDYRVQQILIPDEEGRFPNNPACNYYLQPILSAEPVAAQSLAGLAN